MKKSIFGMAWKYSATCYKQKNRNVFLLLGHLPAENLILVFGFYKSEFVPKTLFRYRSIITGVTLYTKQENEAGTNSILFFQ